MDLLEVIAVGFPFCGFKALVGLVLIENHAIPFLRILGIALLGLGALDGLINGINLIALCVRRERVLDACLLSCLTRRLRKPAAPERPWQGLGNSLDVLLSMTLVAVMIGGGFLRSLAPSRLVVWNACVILNVLGAGLLRFSRSWRDISVRSGTP